MTGKGLDPADRRLRSIIVQKVLNALACQHRRGVVEKVGHGLGARWRVPVA